MTKHISFFAMSVITLCTLVLVAGSVLGQQQVGNPTTGSIGFGSGLCVGTNCPIPNEQCPANLGYIPHGQGACCLDVDPENGICDSIDSVTPPVVTNTGGGGGGGSGRRSTSSSDSDTCVPIWECGVWLECIDGYQTRTCTDIKACDTLLNRPEIAQVCGDLQSTLDLEGEESSEGALSRITGLVVGENGRPTPFGWILVLVLGGILYIVARRYMGGGEGSDSEDASKGAGESSVPVAPVEKTETPTSEKKKSGPKKKE